MLDLADPLCRTSRMEGTPLPVDGQGAYQGWGGQGGSELRGQTTPTREPLEPAQAVDAPTVAMATMHSIVTKKETLTILPVLDSISH